MADLRDFAGRIRIIGKRVEDNADALVRKVATAVDSTVVLATPVDTGRARANWQVNIGSPVETVREAYSAGEMGSTAAANAQAAIEHAKRVIAAYKGGSSVHITNNLSYIGRLNDGWSGQAPAGFVEQAVLIGVAAAQGAGGVLQTALKEEL